MDQWRNTPYGEGKAEHDRRVLCQAEHRDQWAVVQRNGNASAFNGYRWTPSAYSAVQCQAPGCGRVWRTKAAYVAALPDKT